MEEQHSAGTSLPAVGFDPARPDYNVVAVAVVVAASVAARSWHCSPEEKIITRNVNALLVSSSPAA